MSSDFTKIIDKIISNASYIFSTSELYTRFQGVKIMKIEGILVFI